MKPRITPFTTITTVEVNLEATTNLAIIKNVEATDPEDLEVAQMALVEVVVEAVVAEGN